MVVVICVIAFQMAPKGLRRNFGRGPSEEETPARGDLGPIQRVLLAVRPGELSDVPGEIRALEAAVLAHLGSERPAVTLLTVAPPAGRVRADRYLAQMAELFPAGIEITERVARGNPAQAILLEAAKGYDLLAMGAPLPDAGSSYLFGSLVDEVVRSAPCPSLVFTARNPRWPPRTILVPTGGAEPASRAAALAFALAADETEVLLYHVVDPELAAETSTDRAGSAAMRMEIGEGLVNELKERGLQFGVKVATEVTIGGTTVDNLVNRARKDVDLIILGTGVRADSSRLFLGPKVQRLVTEATCSVIVLNV
jgi:nucleotide-binding universal stress UspA family protein